MINKVNRNYLCALNGEIAHSKESHHDVIIKGKDLFRDNIFTIGCLIFLLLIFYYNIANAKEPAEIEDIQVMDYAVKIITNRPITYNLSRPDPFMVVVDMENTIMGKLKDRVFPVKAGITEVSLTQIQNPLMTRLNILLQSPYDIKTEYKDNFIMLNIEHSFSLNPSDDLAEEDVADEIIEILFNKTDKGAKLVIKGNGEMPDPIIFDEIPGKLIIDIPDVELLATIPKIASPFKNIRYKTEKGKLRFIMDIDERSDAQFIRSYDELIIDITADKRDRHKRIESVAKSTNPSPSASNSHMISLDFQDADIIPIFRLLGEVSGYNIVVHPDVKGKITMRLLNVPWEQALDVVLKTFNLEKIVEGNIIRVIPRKVYEEEIKALAAVEYVKEEVVLETKTFVLNYADVEKAAEIVSTVAKKENVTFDKRTRSILVRGPHSVLEEVQRLLNGIDKATPQVLIEARIVEMNTNFARDIGVQWGLMWLSSNWRDSVLGSAGPPLPGGQFPTAINLPASITPSGSAVTFGYLNAAQTLGLDLRLTAAENIGKARIVSSPKIMTIENEKAEITHGTQVPVVTPGTADNPPTVTYKDANLKLVVTPNITPDDMIFLNLEITNDVPDFRPERAILGNVPIDKREAKNKVLVKNGETIVIGGILKTRDDEGEDRVPGLNKLPLLGWLFKRELKKTESQEMLIFITPRIVRQ